jgi:hypothetical protein
VSLSIQTLAVKNELEIGSENCIESVAKKTLLLPIQKSAAKLWRCRFRNRQPKTLSLSIPKSTSKNFVAADSEIGTKTTALPIQKLAAKNYATADSEIDSDGGVISVYFSIFWMFTI